jgi:3-hydroxybutyryl-CoA dehydrogenase
MNIIVIGTAERIAEFSATSLAEKSRCRYISIRATENLTAEYGVFMPYQAVFDLNLDDQPARLANYLSHEHLSVIVSAVKSTLKKLVAQAGQPVGCQLYGINALKGMLKRSHWEISCYQPYTIHPILDWIGKNNIEIKFVADRIGMITPRILFSIINEAGWMLQEGGADSDAIDNAMKLGVNYPKGPFEWLNEMGIKDIVEVLAALKAEAGDKYRISDILAAQYDKSVIEKSTNL